jgi:hypothetical protein
MAKTATDVIFDRRTRTVDFRVDNHGSIVILHALTPAAREWADEHLPVDRLNWGQGGTVVEPRYIDDIVDGIRNDGLGVS